MSLDEATAIGESLAKLNPRAAQRTLYDWVRPRKMLSLKKVSVKKTQKWAAIAGLGMLPDPENEKLIRKLKDEAGEEFSRHCIQTLIKRRRSGIGG